MSHLYTNRNPMTEARRQHVHGPLEVDGLPNELRFRWVFLIASLFVATTIGIAAL